MIEPALQNRPSIHLHIDRLILDGLPVTAAQGPQVRAAMEAELSRLLTEGGLHPSLSSGGSLPQLPAAAMPLPAAAQPKPLGATIARAMYGRIGS
jgi:hypothetical protein